MCEAFVSPYLPESNKASEAARMDTLNRNITIGVGVVLAVLFVLASGRQPEPTNDPWFRQAVLENSHPMVVKFGADWCGPCRRMDAAIDDLEPRFSSRAKFLKIDIDKRPELFTHYGSGKGIPQIMIFKDGEIIAQQRGFGGEEGLKQWLESSL